MQTIQPHGIRDGERLLRGREGWWFFGPGGIAQLETGHLAGEGTLTADAERGLAESGVRDEKTSRTYMVTVLTSTDCNLGCGYCFQNTAQDPTGATRPPRIRHARLTTDTIRSILRFIEGKMAATGLERLALTLFGGEPLLNPRGCRELLAGAADHGLKHASLVSNGTLLNPRVAEQLAELGLRTVQITFDGDRERHDGIRVQRSGGGTFDTIVENIAAVSRSTPLKWTLRVNVSHHSYPGMGGLIEYLAAAVDPSRCALYFAQVDDLGLGYANELQHTDAVADQFIRWHRRAIELGFAIPVQHVGAKCPTCSYRDGRYGAVISADGTLSSCWETAGRPEWQVGTVTDGYLAPAQTQTRWVSCTHLKPFADGEVRRAVFQDTVDAALLDDLASAGRLRALRIRPPELASVPLGT